MDLMAVYQGVPKAKLTVQEPLESSAEQESLIENNIEWFRFYPVISLVNSFKF